MQRRYAVDNFPTKWRQEFSTEMLLTYATNQDANPMGFDMVKIEKCPGKADKFNCTVALSAEKERVLMKEFRSRMTHIVKVKEMNFYGNFHIHFDNENSKTIKIVLESVNKFLPFGEDDKQVLLGFINMQNMTLYESNDISRQSCMIV